MVGVFVRTEYDSISSATSLRLEEIRGSMSSLSIQTIRNRQYLIHEPTLLVHSSYCLPVLFCSLSLSVSSLTSTVCLYNNAQSMYDMRDRQQTVRYACTCAPVTPFCYRRWQMLTRHSTLRLVHIRTINQHLLFRVVQINTQPSTACRSCSQTEVVCTVH